MYMELQHVLQNKMHMKSNRKTLDKCLSLLFITFQCKNISHQQNCKYQEIRKTPFMQMLLSSTSSFQTFKFHHFRFYNILFGGMTKEKMVISTRTIH